MSSLLKVADAIALTADAATTVALLSVFAITCHFIDEFWNLISVGLRVQLMDESHTAVNITSFLNDIMGGPFILHTDH